MSEVENMYSNANIKICKRKQGFTLKDCTDIDCKECGYYDMPPFTAEKQLELIKLIANRKSYPDYEYFGNLFDDYIQLREFNEALARLVNDLWQDLTEEECKQIKEILE